MKNIFLTNKASFYSILAASVLFFSGCGINSRTAYIVNPDLSGKCVFEEKVGLDVAMITTAYGGNYNSKSMSGLSSIFGSEDTVMPSPHDIMLGFASKILSNKSVEAWKDVDFHLIGEDTVYFKGTAYFKNLSTGGMASIDSNIHIYKNDLGQTVIEMNVPVKDTLKKDYSSLFKKNPFKGGVYYSMMHYYMASLLRDYYVSVSYQLPGKIVSVSNFEKKNDNTVMLAINGKKMIHNLDTLMQNIDLLSKMYPGSSGLGSLPSDKNYATYKFLFGKAAPVKVVYETGNKPLFDYAKEVQEAKTYYANFRRKSGLDAFDSIAIAKKELEEKEKKREEGTLILTTGDSANGKMYFKTLTATQYYRGYFSFTGELGHPAISDSYMSSVKINSIVTDKGMDVTDSLTNHDYISAYLTSSNYDYEEKEKLNDKVSFSLNGTFPEDCKYVNIKGMLQIDSATVVPFYIIELNLAKKKLGDYGNDGLK